MEILFENKCVRNEEWAKDINKYIYFRRPIMIVLFALFALYLALGIYNLVAFSDFIWYLILFPVFWILFVIYLYKKNQRILLKRDLELHGEPIEAVVTVTDEMIIYKQSTGSEFRLKYSDVKKAVHTSKYIYLWSKTNMLYSLKSDSFTVGNAEDFTAFLKSKSLKVK